MDQAKSDYFSSQILEAIETVAKSVTSKLEYDQTIICTITDVSNKDNGEYTVSDGSSEFPAYSADTNYTKGTVVYVLVPKGNYDNQKTIVGKYVKESETALTYIPPLEQIIELAVLEGVRPEDSVGPDWGLAANSGGENQTTYVEISLNKSEADFENGFFNCICISGDFRTNLSAYNIKSGTYGLLLQVDKKNTTTNEITTNYYNFNSKQMYGDIYNFNIGINQQYTFDLSQEFQNEIDYRINDIKLFFYESGDFIKLGGTRIEPAKISDNFIKNLFISNVTVHLGLAASDIQSECVKLYTNNGTIFKGERSGGTDGENKKTIQLKWFYPRSGSGIGTYAVIDTLDELTNIGSDVSIYWYKYKIDSAVNDPLAGVFWEPIYKYNDKKYETYQTIEETDENKNKQEKIVYGDISFYISDTNENSTLAIVNANDNGFYKHSYETEDKETVELYFKDGFVFTGEQVKDEKGNSIADKEGKPIYKYTVISNHKRYNNVEKIEKNPFQIDYIPNKILSREKIKVILIKNSFGEKEQKEFNGKSETSKSKLIYQDQSVILKTDELVFENPDGAQALSEVDFIQNVSFEFSDGTNGVYKIYNDIDNKVINWENTKQRTITIKFDNLSSKDLTEEQDTVTVQWTFPNGNTMIAHKSTESDKTTIEGKPADTGDRKGSFSSTYSIGDFYSPMYNNNTIKCSLTKNGKTYNYEVILVFGPTGSNGTSYTLNLSLGPKGDSTQPVPCFTKDSSGEFSVTAQIFDEHGKEISDNKGLEFNWSWIWRYKNNVLEKDIAIGESSDKITLEDGNYYGVIKCETSKTLSWGIDTNKVALTSYLPIGWRSSDAIATYKGTNKIIYDADGLNPIYEKEHRLYDNDGTEISPVSWNVYAKGEKGNDITSLLATFKDSNVLTPSIAYFSDYELTPFYITGTGIGYNYIQPIVYMQNAYGNSALNNWDGQQKIDKDNNIIYSATGIFGLKNNTNGFDGVILGETSYKTGTKEDGSTIKDTTTGVVGLKDGAATFGFSVDGSAFIGPAGNGRIEFNSKDNKAIIQSYQYLKEGSGSYWNLTDGEFRLKGQNGSMSFDFAAGNAEIGGHFIVQQNNKSAIDFQTNSDGTYTALIQSPDFSDVTTKEKGMQLDLINNSFKIYGGNNSQMRMLFEAGGQNNDGQFKIYQGSNVIFNFETNTNSKNETTHTSIIQSAGFKETSEIASSVGSQWNLQEGTFKLYGGNSSAMKFLLDSSENGKFHIYQKGKAIFEFEDGTAIIESSNFAEDTNSIADCVGGQWNLQNGSFKLYGGDENAALKFLLDTDGKFIIYKKSDNNYIKIFDFETNKAIIQSEGYGNNLKEDDNSLYNYFKNYGNITEYDKNNLYLNFDKGYLFADRGLIGSWILDDEKLTSIQVISDESKKEKAIITIDKVNYNLYSLTQLDSLNKNASIFTKNTNTNTETYYYTIYYTLTNNKSQNNYFRKSYMDGIVYLNFNKGIFGSSNLTKVKDQDSWGRECSIYCQDNQGNDKDPESTEFRLNNGTILQFADKAYQSAIIKSITFSIELELSADQIQNDTFLQELYEASTGKEAKRRFLSITKDTLEYSRFKKDLENQLNNNRIAINENFFEGYKNSLGFFAGTFLKDIDNTSEDLLKEQITLESFLRDYEGIAIDRCGSINFNLGHCFYNIANSEGRAPITINGDLEKLKNVLPILKANWSWKNGNVTQEDSFQLYLWYKLLTFRFNDSNLIYLGLDEDSPSLTFLLPTYSISGTIGLFGFTYLTEDENFWNASLYTISDDKLRVGFLRAIGPNSNSPSNVFIGSKIRSSSSMTWSDTDYKFYIQFNGNAGFNIVKCETLNVGTLEGSFNIDAEKISNLSVAETNIQNNAVTTAKIKGGAVTTAKIAGNAVTNAEIEDGAVTGAKIHKQANIKAASYRIAADDSDEFSDERIKIGQYTGVNPNPWAIWAYNTNDSSLGVKNFPWQNGYITSINDETISNVSDFRLKSIQNDNNLLDKYLQVYDNCNTIAYKYKDFPESSGHSRTHCGFIAQEVEKAISDAGLTSEDFAAVQIESVSDEASEELLNLLPDKKRYYLNYNEFHGLHLLKNQQQDRRIEALEQEVKQLREELNRVKGV